METSSGMFPLNFYCRNARLCMKKAAFSKKACLFADELLHLKKFHALVTTTIPAHPQFEDQRTEKQIVELQTYVTETRKRIQQLETELSISKPKDPNPKTRKSRPNNNTSKPLSLPNFCADSVPPSARKCQKVKPKPVSRKLQRQQQNWQEAWPAEQLNVNQDEAEQESPSASSSLSPLLRRDFDVSSMDNLQPFALFGARRPTIDNHNTGDGTDDGRMYRKESTGNSKVSEHAGFGGEGRAHHVYQRAARLSHASRTQNINEFHSVADAAPASQSDLYIDDIDERGEVTDAATSVDPGDESYQKDGFPSFSQSQQSREPMFAAHDGAARNAESMHNDWFRPMNRASHEAAAANNRSQNEGRPSQQATLARTAETVHGIRMALRGEQRDAEDSLATNMRTKLKEEYDKLKEQMKWLKRKDGSPQRDPGAMNRQKQAYKQQNAVDGRRNVGSREGDMGSIHGDSSKHADDCTKQTCLYDDNEDCQKKQRVFVDQADDPKKLQRLYVDQADDPKKLQSRRDASDPSNRENSFEEMMRSSSVSKLPATPSSFDSSLPFSHYISKLKQLVPDHGSADISLPPHPLSCSTQGTRQESTLYEPVEMSHVCSPSSSDTFAESLTYSNPVFDLEGEPESPEWKDKSGKRGGRRTTAAFEDDGLDDGASIRGRQTSIDVRRQQQLYENASSLPVLEKLRRDLACKLINREETECRTKGSVPLDGTGHIDEKEERSIPGRNFRFAKEYCQKKPREKHERGNTEEAEPRQTAAPQGSIGDDRQTLLQYADGTKFDYPQLDTDENHVGVLPDRSFLCSDRDAKDESVCTSETKTRRSPPVASSDVTVERSPGNVLNVRKGNEAASISATVDVFGGEPCLQAKLQQLERDLNDHRISSAREQEAMRGYLDHAMQLILEKEGEKHSFKGKVEHCEEKLRSLQEHVNTSLGELKQTMMKEIRDNASNDMQDVKDAWRGQMEIIEESMSKNVHALRSELFSSMEEIREQQLDRSSLSSTDRRDAIAKMQEELHLVWKDIHQLSKGKEELRDRIGKLTRIAEEAEEYINKESNNLSQKHLHDLRKECSKSKKNEKEMKKDVEGIRQNLDAALAQIKEESQRSKAEAENIRRLEESFKKECMNVAQLYNQMIEASETFKRQFQMVEAVKEEFLRERSRTDHGFFLERVDQLSRFYHCAVEEVREDLHRLKLLGQGRLDEMQFRWEEFVRRHQQQSSVVAGNSLDDLVLDGLETRILHVENILSNSQELKRAQYKVGAILAGIEKDRESASTAAAKAVVTVQKANEVLEALQAELQKTVANNCKFQEDLQMEKKAITIACSEIERVKAVVIEEKEQALVAASEAKQRSFEIWECLQEDMMNLKNSLLVIEKNKEVATTAASEATAAANKAEKKLEELSKTCEETCALYSFAKAGNQKGTTHDEVSERMEELVAAIGKVIQNTAELDEQHKKQESFLHDIGKEVVTTSTDQKGLVDRIADMCKKVQKLENTLGGLSLSIDQVRSSAMDMEQASTKHETAVASVLTQFEKRIHHLENPFHAENPSATKQEGDLSMEKQQLLNLYKEMSCFFKKLQMESEEGDGSNETCHNQKAFDALQLRVGELENQICNVETVTTLTTRTLESRMHFFDAQVQAALAAAMTAQGKCTALGAELVKVFRVLASNKRENVPTQSEDSNEQQIEKKIDTVSRVKAPATHHGVCNSCKKGSTKGPSVSADISTKENAKLEANLKEKRETNLNSMNILKIEGKKSTETPENRSGSTGTLQTNTTSGHSHYTNPSPAEGYTDPSSRAQVMFLNEKDVSIIKMGRITADGQAHNQVDDEFGAAAPIKSACNGSETMDVVRTQNAKMVILEGKLPITRGRLASRRIECATKENIHIGSASRDYQMTDIRLQGGRILVNVSHRSAFISGTRLVKQGDTFTVKAEA